MCRNDQIGLMGRAISYNVLCGGSLRPHKDNTCTDWSLQTMPETSINYVAKEGTITIKITIKNVRNKLKRKRVIKNLNWLLEAIYDDKPSAFRHMRENMKNDYDKCKLAWDRVTK